MQYNLVIYTLLCNNLDNVTGLELKVTIFNAVVIVQSPIELRGVAYGGRGLIGAMIHCSVINTAMS